MLEKLAIGERSKGELASELPLLCRGAYWISGIDTNVGKTVVTGLLARFLLARGVTQVDRLILTHFDADHCNGVRQLLRRRVWAAEI